MSIGRKFALWIVSILLAVSAVTAYVFYTIELREETAKLDLFGRMAGRIIEESLITFMQRRDNPGLSKKLDDVKKNAETISGILLLNRDGVVKAATNKELINKKFGIHDIGLPVNEGSTYRWVSPLENKPACQACHLSSVKNNGVLVIDFSVAEFKRHVREELLKGFVIFGSSTVLMGTIMVLLSRALITRRLKRMGTVMRGFQQGGSAAFAPVEGHDEITNLETGFNEMAEAIQGRENEKECLLRELSAANEELLKEISLRTRGEVMLREQKRFTDNLILNSAVATFVIDADHKIIIWNNACEELTGFRAEDMIDTSDQWKPFYPLKRQTLSDVVVDGNAESLSLLYEKHARSPLTPEGLQAEGWYESLNGKERYIIFDAAPLYDGGGKLIAVIETLQDITERKRLEQKLAQSEGRLRAIIDTEPECVKLIARDGSLLEMNPAGLAMIEADSLDQAVGQRMSSLVVPEYQPAFEALSGKVFRGESGTLEFEIVGQKGTRRWLETHSAPLRNTRGEVFALLGVTRDITERKRIEVTLRESENKFRQVVTSATDAIMVFDAETRQFVEVNRAAEEIYGYSREEWLNMRQNSIPVDQEAADAYIREIVSSKKPLLVPLRYHRKKDGTIFPVEISSSVFIANGRQFVCGIIRDITERKKAEEVIQRNFDTQAAINWVLHISLEDIPLEAVLKQSLDLILSIPWLSFESKGSIFLVEGDPNKLVMKAQRGLADPLREECKIVPFGKCLCGRAAARGEVQFADSIDERHEIRYEGMVPHGHYCVPIMHAKTVLGVINMYIKEGHVRDEKEIEFLSAMASALAGIIQRNRAEGEREKLIGDLRNVLSTVSRSRKEWQDTFDSITDMIAIVDKDFTILKANRAFSAYYGLHPRDVINKKCYELIHDGDALIPNCPHRTTLAEMKPSGKEIFDKRTKRTFRIFTFPYNSPDGEIIGSIHIMRDITDDKEQEMRLITSERLAALGQMASGIAHEINNPLASIAGCSEGLLSRVKKGQCDNALFESYLSIIQEEVFRCKSITTAMLSFVRKTTYEKQDIDLTEAIDKTIEIIGFQGRLKNIEIKRKYHEPSPAINGNGGEVRQVILAVITNALDAMNDKGTLTIETEAREGSSIIRISDTGEGISPEIITRIFDPFFTTKSERGGTGLGLSIARKIVANHNGHIDASPAPGHGATFIITFPQ